MFSRLVIDNFKCLGHFDRRLAPLTLLTGFNAAGKSSVIQSMALLRQTIGENEWTKALQLNGSSVALGTMADAIDRNYGGTGFSLGLEGAGWACKWDAASADRKRDLVAPLENVLFEGEGQEWRWSSTDRGPQIATNLRRLLPVTAWDSSPLARDVHFQLASMCHVGAERIGPREVYEASCPLMYPDVGARGEKTPLCLEQFADSDVNEGLVIDGVPKQVRLLVTAWMGMLFPGFGYEIKRVDATNLVVMGVRTSPKGDLFRPTNVGFGITHVLPIVTACVAALPKSTLLVENPESHLHPSGQSQIGTFLARAASAGTQVIVETHSDHVLNGVRRAIRDKKIAAGDVSIYFFHSKTGPNGEPATQIDEVKVGATGQLSGWPPGFFDQLESDLEHIHGQ